MSECTCGALPPRDEEFPLDPDYRGFPAEPSAEALFARLDQEMEMDRRDEAMTAGFRQTRAYQRSLLRRHLRHGIRERDNLPQSAA